MYPEVFRKVFSVKVRSVLIFGFVLLVLLGHITLSWHHHSKFNTHEECLMCILAASACSLPEEITQLSLVAMVERMVCPQVKLRAPSAVFSTHPARAPPLAFS